MPLDLLSYSGEGSHLGKKKKKVSALLGFFLFVLSLLHQIKVGRFQEKILKTGTNTCVFPAPVLMSLTFKH